MFGAIAAIPGYTPLLMFFDRTIFFSRMARRTAKESCPACQVATEALYLAARFGLCSPEPVWLQTRDDVSKFWQT